MMRTRGEHDAPHSLLEIPTLMTSSLPELAAKISRPYDLIFIDADKISYPNYLTLILSHSTAATSIRLLKPGGIIVADNILRRGLVADASDANPWSLSSKQAGERAWRQEDIDALDRFNKELVGNERLETFLLPLFDGLGLGRLKD